MPALVLDDGSTIGEATVIMRYLDFAAKALPDSHKAVKRWYALVSSRPSMAA